MNISTISFKGIPDNDIDIPEWVNSRHPQNRRTVNSRLEKVPQSDTYSNTQIKNSSHKKSSVPKSLKILIAGLGAALAINHAAGNINQSLIFLLILLHH